MTAWHEQDEFWESVPMFTEHHLEIAAEEVECVVSLAGIEPGARVLDMPCGVGRHSLELARRGLRVTGVDRTGAYLQIARERAGAENLEVEWIEADMRDFVQHDAFDAAVNLYTSFGYFADPAQNRQVLANLYRSLKPGGTLVMEMMGKEILARIFQPRDWQQLPDGAFYLQERTVTQDWSWIDNRWILVHPDGRRQEFELGHRIYDAAGLKTLLRDADFTGVEVFGSLHGTPYDTEARRLVAVARKGPR
jgi:SAM-dependent methyltransferase